MTSHRTLFLLLSIVSLQVFGSVVKNATIENREYLCRPADIEPKCNLSTDVGVLIGLAADSADAYSCLRSLSETNGASIQKCFLQRRIKVVARELDIQIASGSCRQALASRCALVEPCPPPNIKLKCGHLGAFLQTIEDLNLNSFFTKADGELLCNSLVN